MRVLSGICLALLIGRAAPCDQKTFQVSGTPIPSQLLQANYGRLPAGIAGYDLNVCNVSTTKQAVVRSEIYQALAQSTPGLQPVGGEIMLAAILRTQNRSTGSIAMMVLNSATTVLSVLSSSKYNVPTGLVTGAALGAISGQQLLNNFRPVLSADMLANFQRQVLEPALVLDSGSCVERTVFATIAAPAQQSQPLSFHVR